MHVHHPCDRRPHPSPLHTATYRRLCDCGSVLCGFALSPPPAHPSASTSKQILQNRSESRALPPTPRHASPRGSAHIHPTGSLRVACGWVRYGLHAQEPPLTLRAHPSTSTFNMALKQIPRIAASRERSPLFRTSLNLSTQSPPPPQRRPPPTRPPTRPARALRPSRTGRPLARTRSRRGHIRSGMAVAAAAAAAAAASQRGPQRGVVFVFCARERYAPSWCCGTCRTHS